jgi:drug/metabolite transporter (DMT)-like permease
MNKNLKGTLILALTAIIWGISFVSQSVSMEHIGPNTFAGIRTLLGCATLLPVIMFRNLSEKRNPEIKEQKGSRKYVIIGGIICGVLLCIASTVQTYGMKYTTAGKSGFITAMYMILVPIVSIFMGKKIRPSVIGCVLIAVTGLYFLCIKKGEFSIGYGDLVTLICAVFFTFHILVIDHYSPKVDGIKLSCM